MWAEVERLRNWFASKSRPSRFDQIVIDAVRAKLDVRVVALWDEQVRTIYKVQRLPHSVEVDFCRIRDGRPCFDPAIAFPNKSEELLAARVDVSVRAFNSGIGAHVWSVKGFLFSIEYEGSPAYLEEMQGMDEIAGKLGCTCELMANLASDA